MSKATVLVYDDEEAICEAFVRKLRKSGTVVPAFEVHDALTNQEFQKELGVLEERRTRARGGTKPSTTICKLDAADVLILDYDLFKAQPGGASIVGEDVAYLARCYSTCGVLIGVNQFGPNTFDLTLRGHPGSFADLNVGGDQIHKASLWGGGRAGLSPWYWPDLPAFIASFKGRVDDALANIDDPVLETLAFPPEVVASLPRTATEFLVGSAGKSPEKITFREFVEKSGNGLRRKDRSDGEEMLARIAAARISKWLERLVLPGQDVLVDAPHLVARFPSLLIKPKKMGDWQTTVRKSSIAGLRKSKIADARFKKDFWLSRPAWYWPLLCGDERIAEVKDPWSTERPDWVFAEDTSRFMQRTKCREFVIESDSPFVRRHVKGKVSGVSYSPKVRFAL